MKCHSLGRERRRTAAFAGNFPSRSFKHKGPNNSTIFNRWIHGSVLTVITSLQHILRSYKHEAFQKANYKLDLIEQPCIPWQNTFSLTTTVDRLNKHSQFTIQSSPWVFFPVFVFLLLHLVSSFPFLIYKQLVRKEVRFPVVAWNIVKCFQSSKQWFHSCRTCSIEVYFGVFRIETSKLRNSDSCDEKEMILKQNSDVLVPNILERLILLFIFSSKYREQTEVLLCLVPG